VAAPKWQRRAEDRPREICAAALEVFAERGFAAARLEEMARRAGVSKGTLYLYFKDKEDLFRAVVRDTVAPNIDAVQQAVLASGLPFADVATRLPVGAVAKMVIGESRNFPELAKVWHDQVASRALTMLAGLIEKAQAKGEVRAGDPRLHALTLMGPMLMGVRWRETLEPVGAAPVDIDALAWQHAETVLAGLLTGSAR
jgi:AcrR family transcriptional regulator